jgi:hypothetical protein
MKHTPIKITRDARNGQFKPQPWGTRHPNISERETIYKPSPKKG